MSEPGAALHAYAGLDPTTILACVESLGPRCDGRLLALNSYENRVYRVGCEDGEPLVAKFYRPGRWSDAAIGEEHDFSRELEAAEVPVVAPLELAGRTLHRHRGFRFALYPCRGGRAPELDDPALLAHLGRMLARLHRVGELRPFAHRPRVDLESYGIASRDYLLEAGFVPAELGEAYRGICEHLFANIRGCLERAAAPREIRLHGDFHPGNLLVEDGRLHVVDLDDARRGPAVQDLWMFLSGPRPEQEAQLGVLLEGYCQFRAFDARELNLIEALRALRILHTAAWLARRWTDPAFPRAFPWFAERRYWDEHILALREQIALTEEQPLRWQG